MADIVQLLFKVVADTGKARRELTEMGRQVSDLSRSFQQLGTSLTASITLPLAALGAAAAKSAIDIDRQVNVLKAFTGSAANAEKRLAELIATAQKTPGLTASLAATLDAQLRVANVTEQTINRILPTIGRLNAVSPLGDPQRFATNLVQLVTQNFERADLKELVGQSPLAGELIKQVFNVDSPINAEAIRTSAQRLGIRTADEFFTALAQASTTNPKLSLVSESIAAQLEKLTDRVTIALRPLGLAIVETLTPIVETVVPIIEGLSRAFAGLPQPVQFAIIALGGVAAAIGPIALTLGIAGQAVVAFSEAWVILQGALAAGGALAFLPALINPVTLALVGIAAVLGVAAFAWATYEDATDRAAKITVEQIKSQQTEITQLETLQRQVSALAVAQGSSADRHAQLQSILARLDPDTRAYIGSITDENLAIAELNRVLKEQIGLKQQGLSRNLGDIADAAGELQDKINRSTQALALLEQQSRQFAESGGRDVQVIVDDFGRNLSTVPQSAEEFGRAINSTKKNIGGARDAFAAFGAEIAAFINQNKLSIDAFTQQQLALGRTQAQVNLMVAAFEAFQKKQADAASSAKSTTSEIDKQRAAIDALISSLDKLNQTANDQVDKQIRQIALTSRNAAEAKARLQEALKLDDDFFAAVQNRQRVQKNEQALDEVLNPSKRGAGRAAATARAVASAELKLLQQVEKEQELSTRRQSEQIRRALDDRLIDIRTFTDRAIAFDQELLKAKLATLKEEESVATRTAKNKTEAEARRGEITLRANQAILESELRQEELRRNRRDAEQRAEEAHQRRLIEIREISRRATEQAIREAASRGAIGAVEAEQRLIDIERERLDERKARLQEEFILARANVQEQRRINDELAKLAAERAEFEAEATRRIQAAQASSIRALRQFLQERRKIIEETAATQVELLRQEAEAARVRANLELTPDARREAIKAELAAEEAAADLRHRLALARIEDDRAATVEAAGKNAGLVEQAERASNDRRIAEEQRFQNEKKLIRENSQREETQLDPSSNQSIFGTGDEESSRLTAFGQTAAAALSQVSQAAGNMKTILTGALSQIASGLQSTLQAFILTGKGGVQAFKQLAAGVIAAVASQALVKAIFETAEGFAALAAGRPIAAAQHFAAAKIYGVVGAVAGGLGLAIKASGGLGGGTEGGFGSGASASAPAFDKQRDLRVGRGNPFGEDAEPIRETVSEGQGGPFGIIKELATEIRELRGKLSSMSPGDVVVVGASQRPDAIASAALEEQRRNGDFTRAFGLNLGLT